MKTQELVIASTNVHKIREMRSMLKRLSHLDIYSLLDYPEYQPPEETGKTFAENAALKALHAAQSLNRLVLADDSGLVVPALNGRPGVYSARFAGLNASDKENRMKLLKEMESLPEAQRHAYFECCLALASPQKVLKTVNGICEGSILTEERGCNGFGYDSIFIKHDYGKTFAELEEEVKNRVSHRRKAMDKLLITLESLCPKPMSESSGVFH